MRQERRSSDSDFSLAEEGEATPLIGSDEDGSVAGKWYTGPLFVTGVKLAGLFMVFTAILLGTFYWGIPTLDPEDRSVLKLPRSFEDLQNLKWVQLLSELTVVLCFKSTRDGIQRGSWRVGSLPIYCELEGIV